MTAKIGLMVILGVLALASLFGGLDIELLDEESYGIRVQATLIDVDKIDGGYRCTVRAQVTNKNDFDVMTIYINLTVLTEDGAQFYSNEETLYLLKAGETWQKDFKVDVTTDPGDSITIYVNGRCNVKGQNVDIYKKIQADVPG